MDFFKSALAAIDTILSHPMALALAPVALAIWLKHRLTERRRKQESPPD
jgi:hypothetical protein